MSHPALTQLLRTSRGVEADRCLDTDTRRWADELLPGRGASIVIHSDQAARRAAALRGCTAFTIDNHIYLGELPPFAVKQVLRHELVHAAQVALGKQTGRFASREQVEHEAEQLARASVASPVTQAARSDRPYDFVWFVAIGVGLYVVLRPGVANAPAPSSPLRPSPSLPQIVAESLVLFAVPGGAMRLGARLGLGFLGSSALGGATVGVGMRAVQDVGSGSASPPLLYVFDATTGAVLGFVVAGGVRFIGQVGTVAFDRLATYGLVAEDIVISQRLAEAAARAPLDATQAQAILQRQGLAGRVSEWWLQRRGLIVLYRGQAQATPEILSPLAREQGVAASEELLARIRQAGFTDAEIAGFTARWHVEPIPPHFAGPELGWQPLGAVGIPTTRIPGIAADFGSEGVIYILRTPRTLPVAPIGWQGLAVESEQIIFNQVPAGTIIQRIPASRVAPLSVNDRGLLIPGINQVGPR